MEQYYQLSDFLQICANFYKKCFFSFEQTIKYKYFVMEEKFKMRKNLQEREVIRINNSPDQHLRLTGGIFGEKMQKKDKSNNRYYVFNWDYERIKDNNNMSSKSLPQYSLPLISGSSQSNAKYTVEPKRRKRQIMEILKQHPSYYGIICPPSQIESNQVLQTKKSLNKAKQELENERKRYENLSQIYITRILSNDLIPQGMAMVIKASSQNIQIWTEERNKLELKLESLQKLK